MTRGSHHIGNTQLNVKASNFTCNTDQTFQWIRSPDLNSSAIILSVQNAPGEGGWVIHFEWANHVIRQYQYFFFPHCITKKWQWATFRIPSSWECTNQNSECIPLLVFSSKAQLYMFCPNLRDRKLYIYIKPEACKYTNSIYIHIYVIHEIFKIYIYIHIYIRTDSWRYWQQPRNLEVSTGTHVYGFMDYSETSPKITLCRRLSSPTIQILSSPETWFKIRLLWSSFLNPAHPPSSEIWLLLHYHVAYLLLTEVQDLLPEVITVVNLKEFEVSCEDRCRRLKKCKRRPE